MTSGRDISENRSAAPGVSDSMNDAPVDLSDETSRLADPAPMVDMTDAGSSDVSLTMTEAVVVQPIDVAYRRLYPGMVRLAILLVDTREHAEEIVQDAFSRAYPRWHRIVNHDAYVRATVLNLCRKAHRRRAVARRAPQYPVPDAPGADEVADHVVDTVRALPSPMREIVVMRYYLQASDTEIADTLRLPAGTVKSTLHRAKTILRKELS